MHDLIPLSFFSWTSLPISLLQNHLKRCHLTAAWTRRGKPRATVESHRLWPGKLERICLHPVPALSSPMACYFHRASASAKFCPVCPTLNISLDYVSPKD